MKLSTAVTVFYQLSVFITTSAFLAPNKKTPFLHLSQNIRYSMTSSSNDDAILTTKEITSINTESPLKHISGVKSIADKYSTILLDMWGVMHDGTNPYDGAIDTVRQLRKHTSSSTQPAPRLIILSNSSKRKDDAMKTLRKVGFDPLIDFDDIITSGDISYRMLSGDKTLKCSSWDTLTNLINNNKKNVFVFGSGDNDEDYCTSCGWTVSSINDADLIIARGTFTLNDGSGNVITKHDDEDRYFAILNSTLHIAADRRIPMLITNPDKVRPDKGLPPMPGAIGDAYERILNERYSSNESDHELRSKLVKRIGKPYPEVYELALLDNANSKTAIMVGDALETDVSGGTWSKCDTLWVIKDGIHAYDVDEQGDGNYEFGVQKVLDAFNSRKGYSNGECLRPTYVVPHFRW